MFNMRVWCHDPLSGQTFCDSFQFNARIFPTSAMVAEAIYRLYCREAPHIEVVKVSELLLIEKEF